MDINQSNADWLRILEWPQKAVSEFRPNALQPQFTSQDQYRITKALCVSNAGAESCDPQKNPYANSLLELFKDVAPTPDANSKSGNQTAVGFAWNGNDYRLLCDAGACILQKQVVVEKSEWEQFLTGGLLTGCSPSPQETRFEDVGSFGDAIQKDMISEYLSDTPKDVAPTLKCGTSNNDICLAVAISARGNTTCAILATGAVLCWGQNNFGQLGDGTTNNSDTPVVVKGINNGTKTISVGSSTVCAVNISGAVQCWGSNFSKQLGNGTTANYSATPIIVSGFNGDVQTISIGEQHSCALLTSGDVQCWGQNNWGQLSSAAIDDSKIPVTVAGLNEKVKAIGVGDNFTCALLMSGAVKCWGYNAGGVLGNMTKAEYSFVPLEVGKFQGDIQFIGVGISHACAVLTTGLIQCWGYNSSGMLGNGTTANSSTPVAVTGLGGQGLYVSLGLAHTCTLLTSGGVQCWGHNMWDQLGNGAAKPEEFIPISTMGLDSNIQSISAGNYHTCALLATGAIKCWGNSYGKIPVKIQGLGPQ